MKLATYSRRQMCQRPGRTILTLLGIVIGVSAIVSISMTIERTRGTYRSMFEELTGRASLEVTGSGMSGFDPDIVERLRGISGIKAAVPVVQTPAGLVTESGTLPILALGVDVEVDGAVRDFELRGGAMIGQNDGALLSATFAESHGLELGRNIRLLTATGLVELPLVGLLEPRGAAAINGGAVAFIPLKTAQRVFDLNGLVNSVQIVLDEDAAPADVQARVQQALPVGLTVQSPAARGELASQSLFAIEQGLAVMSVVSLVAAAFVILNSFLMNIGERRRQLAILRALGATRRQVTRLLLSEGLLLGVIGTLIGIPVGIALAVGLSAIMAEFLDVALPPFRLSIAPILSGALLGPAVAIAASWAPARQVAQRPPLEGLQDVRTTRVHRRGRWSYWLGAGLLAAGMLLVAAIVGQWLPLRIISPILPVGMALFVVAAMLLLPLISRPGLRACVTPIRRLFGVEGGIALRQLSRRPDRTNLTVGVLAVSVMVSLGFGGTLLNSIRDTRQFVGAITGYDYFIRGTLPDVGIMAAAVMPETLADRLVEIDGVTNVDKLTFMPARAGDLPIIVQAHTVDATRPLPIDLKGADPLEIGRRMMDGEVVIGTVLAQRTGLDSGNSIILQTPRGPIPFKIAATCTEYAVGGWVLHVEWETGKRLLDMNGVHVFMLETNNNASPELARYLQDFVGEHGLSLESMADFRNMVDDAMSGVVASLWMLMALVFVVASFGVVNTLTMNVLEQTRELGVLRAIAMTRRQIRRMVLSQALSMGLVSLAPGIVGGLGLAWMMHICTPTISGYSVEYHFETALLIGCIVVALAVSAAAAILPARRAANLRIISALQYE